MKDNEHVVIAKMDATANEILEVEINSFPTLYMFKRGAKSSPLEYEGERDLESMHKFVMSTET